MQRDPVASYLAWIAALLLLVIALAAMGQGRKL